ncbi:tetratricopeptide repeat protein [Candidatus Pelagibacter sp.]|nr:tetratricopeptide repeat protein [Candidatus Pelagibacter sp.]
MISKFYKIIFICLIFFVHNISYSKNSKILSFNENNVSNYFSALVSFDNNKESLKFFHGSRDLKETHKTYIKNYIFSLISDGKINKAIYEIQTIKNKNFLNFFESHLLLLLNQLKKKNYKESLIHLNDLKKYREEGTFELIISSVLEDYILLFDDKKINYNKKNSFGQFSQINLALQSCYLDKPATAALFQNVINYENDGSSRYLFFYINYLLSQKNFTKVTEISRTIDYLDTTLLVSQTKMWIEEKNYINIEKIFSCKNPNDIISELFFVISNLYSSENQINKSNFYFNLSNYFNPKFKYNLTLLSNNYLQSKNFFKSKKILNNFNKKDKIYHWYKIKKNTEIIETQSDDDKSFTYLNIEFKKIKKPYIKIIYDMANIAKKYGLYDLSIEYYSTLLLKLDSNSLMYAKVLYRRGGSYERIGNEKKSDKDLIQSLNINPNQPDVLNYLAYDWLERGYKINDAIEMLEKAYEKKKNDPYIIDSIGWAYYLIGNYVKAEKLLKKALQLMPRDPVVNDHYGDVLWKLDRKLQANYYWKSALTFDETESAMKDKIYYKILKGPNKI